MNTQTPSRYFRSGDLARVACSSCEGCGECCRGMGDTIVTDPYDIYQLHAGLGLTFADLLNSGRIGLHNENGLTLPHLAMRDESGACSFLGDDGRCTIHALRPGICRLFPLARDYSDGSVRYFILPDACPRPGQTKVRISRWLGIPDPDSYEQFKLEWHGFLRDLGELAASSADRDTLTKLNYVLLEYFYLKPFDGDDFYLLAHRRMTRIRRSIGISFGATQKEPGERI